MSLKRGSIVAVCHDGKWGRRVKGEVVATRKGHHILVRFPHPETGEPVEFWARRGRTIRHLLHKPDSCMCWCKRYATFSGWADIDWRSPWYSVLPWRDEDPHETLADRKMSMKWQ